jgi:hypothetical protein
LCYAHYPEVLNFPMSESGGTTGSGTAVSGAAFKVLIQDSALHIMPKSVPKHENPKQHKD